MDTSEQYIKMTLALPESMLEKMEECRWFYVPNPDRTVRLFEQDQLQEMVYSPQPQGYGYDKLVSLRLFEWSTEYSEHYKCMGYKEYPNSFKSMEQLWLSFVMFECWNKTWSGTAWI